MSIPFPAGGIDSTVEDMHRWNEALSAPGERLSSDSPKQRFAEYPEATHERQHYSHEVVISRLKFGQLLSYHGGGVEGFSSSIQRHPDDRVCIVVLSNFASYKPWELGDHIASDLFAISLSTRFDVALVASLHIRHFAVQKRHFHVFVNVDLLRAHIKNLVRLAENSLHLIRRHAQLHGLWF